MKNLTSSVTLILSVVLLLALGSLVLTNSSSAQKSKIANQQREAAGVAVAESFNQFLAIQVANNGRFNMGAFPNNTGGAGANSYDLTYRWPETPDTSYSTIRIDGADNIYGSSGTVIESPRDIDAKTNRSKWKVGDIEITQILQLVLNPQTGREDLGKISYVVKNVGSASHSVGQRIMLDTEIAQNDGVPFRVPGVGIVRNEMEFVGSAIPDTFLAFFDVTRSDRVSTSVLKSNVEIVPDRLVLASWPRIVDARFDYTINPNLNFTGDSAYAVYWNARTLAAGESRTYTTYYGLAKLDTDLQPPLALSVDGPSLLSVVNNQYSPNPFDVVATVFNNGNGVATDVKLSLNLPSGLSLVSGSATQAIGNLSVGQERQVTWRVQASAQSSATTLSYSVTATASNAATKTVNRQIQLSAIYELELIALEVTQAIQNLNNLVPLIQDKRTFVRAHVRSPLGNLSQVSAKLIGTRIEGNNRTLLGELMPSNTGQTIKVLQTPQRTNLDDSFYFELPGAPQDWRRGKVELEFRGISHTFKCVPDSNSCKPEVTFEQAAAPDVTMVGLVWKETGILSSIRYHEPTLDDLVRAKQQIEALFPIPRLNAGYSCPAFFEVSQPTTAPQFDDILGKLGKMRTLDGCIGPDDRGTCKRHYLGVLIDGTLAGTLGEAYVPGYTAAGYLNSKFSSAHEFAHNAERPHTFEDPDFMPKDGTISEVKDDTGFFGFDIFGFLNNGIYDWRTFDLMNYEDRRWVSPHTYLGIKNYFATHLDFSLAPLTKSANENLGLAVIVGQPAVIVGGSVSLNGVNGEIGPIYVISSPNSISLPSSGTHTIQFENSQGQQIASYNFEPDKPSQGTTGLFTLLLPFHPNTTRIVLLRDGQVIASRNVSTNAPTVTVTYPNGGEVLTNSTATFTWAASDADGDPLSYIVQYSRDGGATWQTLITDLTATSYQVNLNMLAGTNQGLIRVFASDGYLTAQDTSNATFTVAKHAPNPNIQSPENNRLYVGNQTITLEGNAYDIEDGQLGDETLTWRSSLDGVLGNGHTLSVNASSLTPGNHTISLSAKDSDGQIGSSSISIQVARERPVFPAKISLAPRGLNFTVKASNGQPPAQMLAIRNGGDGTINWAANADQNWIQLDSKNGVSPAALPVTVNPQGLRVGQYTGHVAVTSPDVPNSTETVEITLNIIEEISANLAIISTLPPNPIASGSQLTYTITVTNQGPDSAGNIVVSDNLPAATTFVSCAATNGGSCGGTNNNRTVTIPSLAFAASATITLTVKVNDSVAAGTIISNTATVSAATPDLDTSNNSTISNFTTILSQYEADVAPRPNGNGNGTVTMADWVQLGRFYIGSDTATPGSEYQRADCFPKDTKGDGKITIGDWVQAGRYAAGLDPVVPAGGPTAFLATLPSFAAKFPLSLEAQTRNVRIRNANFLRGQIGTLQIELEAQGNENATAFSLNYDPRMLTFVDAKAGDDVNGAALQINRAQSASGRLGFALVLAPGQQLAAGTRTLVSLRFIPNGGEGVVATNISFSDQLLAREVVDQFATPITAVNYTSGTIAIRGRAAAHVSGASYVNAELAADSIASAFGMGLASMTVGAVSLPLPNMLGGTAVKVKDALGVERIAPLFFVSPNQVNYQIPAGTADGIAAVTITNGLGEVTAGLLNIGKVAPGIFSADASGKGWAAAEVVSVASDGSQTMSQVARFDVAQNKIVAVPIDVQTNVAVLVLYGTGIRQRSDVAQVKVKVGGIEAAVEYAGAQPGYAGLDQINVRLPKSLVGRGEVTVELSVEGKAANAVRILLK